jgi:epoxyqueuosine reductase
LTIENKGAIPDQFRVAMGNRIYGCDECQTVCPWNKKDWKPKGGEDARSASPLFGDVPLDVSSPSLSELLALSESGFKKRFTDTAIVRIGVLRFLRNGKI